MKQAKTQGIVGRHGWTDGSFVCIRYERIFGRNYKMVATVHFEPADAVSDVWRKIQGEFEDGSLHGNFLSGMICACFNRCVVNGVACEMTDSQIGWWIDGRGRMRKGKPDRSATKDGGEDYPDIIG